MSDTAERRSLDQFGRFGSDVSDTAERRSLDQFGRFGSDVSDTADHDARWTSSDGARSDVSDTADHDARWTSSDGARSDVSDTMEGMVVVLLYPGAGSDRDHSSLVAIEDRLGRGAHVVRSDFPYRRDGRRAPDRPPKLMASIREDLAAVARRRGPIVMGGRSMGGRMATMVAADVDGVGPVDRLAGLVAISYPLHPPGKADRLRVEHLPRVHVPCLFVSGTRDPFGSPDELTSWTATIPAPVEHVWIEGGRHDLRGADEAIADAVAGFVAALARPG